MQRRADSTGLEFIDIGGELPAPGLSAHRSDVATRESVRLPDWLREVNGHRTTVADFVDPVGGLKVRAGGFRMLRAGKLPPGGEIGHMTVQRMDNVGMVVEEHPSS